MLQMLLQVLTEELRTQCAVKPDCTRHLVPSTCHTDAHGNMRGGMPSHRTKQKRGIRLIGNKSFLVGLLAGLVITSIVNVIIQLTYLCVHDQVLETENLERYWMLQKDKRAERNSRFSQVPGPRILCWLMTSPENMEREIHRVNATWARRCDKFLIFSSKSDPKIPVIVQNVSEGLDHLTAKTMQALSYIYKSHLYEVDWFMKADDDTFLIVENLRHFLSTKSTNEALYFGQYFKNKLGLGYMSGGAGYVLSRKALRMLFENGINSGVCQLDGGSEDEVLGECLKSVGVTAQRSLDKHGKSLFHCFEVKTHVQGIYPLWYNNMDAVGNGIMNYRNISDVSISFHSIGYSQFYTMEYVTYHIRPFGVTL